MKATLGVFSLRLLLILPRRVLLPLGATRLSASDRMFERQNYALASEAPVLPQSRMQKSGPEVNQ
jgi:hypothetical protein